jgi:hypothetical protein
VRRSGLPVLALALATTGCSTVGSSADEFREADDPPPIPAPSEIARRHITAADTERHVRFLAADIRRGRVTPSPELQRSAAWLSALFQEAGLEPAGDGYLQYWPHPEADSGGGPVPAPNVAARLPGADLTRAGEHVILVAHFDGLGVGEPDESGDSIYNGADDNASGVAALVEVAQAMAALPEAPPRPVLFLAVSGGEQGRLGSRWWVQHPTIDLTRAVAVLELDMVGRNHPDSVYIAGADGPVIESVLERLASDGEDVGLAVARYAGAALEPGDPSPFARAGIPVVIITSGPHEDLHTPNDEMDDVSFEKVARVARLVFAMVHGLAAADSVPD